MANVPNGEEALPEITQTRGLLCNSRSFKVIEFDTNQRVAKVPNSANSI